MNETMGQIIRRLRREQNLTQEELAEQLLVSAQAVSKWENGTSMPDIAQIVPLANFFGVSTDVLFGVCGTDHREAVRARLEEIYRLCDHCEDGREGETALVVLDRYRDALRIYPNNTNLLTEAMAFAEMVISCNHAELAALIGEEGIEALTREVIRWAELVIKYGTSQNDVLSARRRLFAIYIRQKKWDDAEKLADDFPRDPVDTRGALLAELKHKSGRTAEERLWRCANFRSLVSALGREAAMLGNGYMREQQYADALSCFTFLRDMVEALYRHESYRPPFVFDHYPLYGHPACCLVQLGRMDEAVDLLEAGVDFMLAQAEAFNQRKTLEIPLLRDCSFGYGYDGDAVYHDLPGKMERFVFGEAFRPLQNHPRYQQLIDRVMAMRG